jgi:hypothetical protein
MACGILWLAGLLFHLLMITRASRRTGPSIVITLKPGNLQLQLVNPGEKLRYDAPQFFVLASQILVFFTRSRKLFPQLSAMLTFFHTDQYDAGRNFHAELPKIFPQQTST